MKTKTLLAALALTALPGLAAAQCFGDHAKEQVTMSCAAGSVFDAETQRCVPTTG
ncbi:adenylosuccinate lyase [Alphaproteobacteria bacterium GH1-50]|uniref:Adenylosuccinate lyase n=1 Tax=Kangsaoukella pontilimi TaxID=2691042 RepID=A0A7C9IGN8_9RHOB|nr:adenylosuccinate lyase [Kangsaoukella pontilimi]MXQ07022.1 adenylosuccinate lyase [Kangsaoukella pontilimi]